MIFRTGALLRHHLRLRPHILYCTRKKTEGTNMGIFDQEKDGKDVDDLIYGDDRAISQR